MSSITQPLPTLPRAPTEACERLCQDQQRGLESERARIDEDAERTLVTGEPVAAAASSDAAELGPGSRLVVVREVDLPGGPQLVHEHFVIKERLSSDRNIAGDVFRATRSWDERLYGDVVLKKPKASLRDSGPAYDRVRRDLAREQHCLFRFARHPSLLAPTGPAFEWEGELVVQTQYLPWSIGEYLSYFSDEGSLTRALAGVACQGLGAIEHLARIREEDGPAGYAHVDLKASHLRMDYRERHAGDGEWVVVIIDLDSVLPVGPVCLAEAKYNRACVDPEKFMALHDESLLCTVDPCETVYALALTLLRVLAEGMGVVLERRGLEPVGLASDRNGRTVAIDADALLATVHATREVDRRNLSSVFWTNRQRRLAAGEPEVPVPSLEALLEGDSSSTEVVDAGSPPGWSVRPDLFLALHECLRPRAERLDPARLRAVFTRLL